jgi:hypothetical protein
VDGYANRWKCIYWILTAAMLPRSILLVQILLALATCFEGM